MLAVNQNGVRENTTFHDIPNLAIKVEFFRMSSSISWKFRWNYSTVMQLVLLPRLLMHVNLSSQS